MSKKLTRNGALEKISTWNTNDVLLLLRKNGLEECCVAVSKRQIDGEELLNLTEIKLALWKSDLTRSLIWKLRTFVENVKQFPEKYIEEKIVETEQQNEDHMSDDNYWDTDFEDEIVEDYTTTTTNTTNTTNTTTTTTTTTSTFTNANNINDNEINFNYANDHSISEKMKNIKMDVQVCENTNNVNDDNINETTYENFGSTLSDVKNVYVKYQDDNVTSSTTNQPVKNISRLHSTLEKSLAEQLKEKLELRNLKKPIISPKPEILVSKNLKDDVTRNSKQLQKSTLHDDLRNKLKAQNDLQRRMGVPPPPTPKKSLDQSISKVVGIQNEKDVPPRKLSLTIRNLDLIANLPTRDNESEDEYEQFDGNIIEQNQRSVISRISNKQSSTIGGSNSAEGVYQLGSTSSSEEEEHRYQIYESIKELPEDNDNYVRPIQRVQNKNNTLLPPLLPIKPPITPPSTLHRKISNNANERSPDKKSATLPHSGSNTSLSPIERASRPLPPPPDRLSYIDKPWFHNVTRSQAITLITEQNSYGNPQDGYFLLRPSTTNANNPLALVLWCKDRVYNIPVRKRSDNRYALGSTKLNEQSFSSVEEIVTCYTKEELVLYTGGKQTGSTKLTDTPSK